MYCLWVLITSSLLLESKPTSPCRLCFSVIPRRRSRSGSSLNARPMFTGLGLPATNSGSSHPDLPILVRFSDRSLLRAVHGRPGKRAFATPCAFKPATLAGDDASPPDAAIIYSNSRDGRTDRKVTAALRGKMDYAVAKARDRKKHRCIMGNELRLRRSNDVDRGEVCGDGGFVARAN